MNEITRKYYLYVLNKVKYGNPAIRKYFGKLSILCHLKPGTSCMHNCFGYAGCILFQHPRRNMKFEEKAEEEDRLVKELIRRKLIPYILHVRFKDNRESR